jgi:hypothetical protein
MKKGIQYGKGKGLGFSKGQKIYNSIFSSLAKKINLNVKILEN